MVGTNELYMAPDKNGFQSKLEIQVRKLRRAVLEETGMAGERVFANKTEGFLAIDYVPMAKVVLAQHTDTTLYWNKAAAEAQNVDQEAVQANFSAISRAQNVEWSL